MSNVLSGEGWTPKWETKVVTASMTKARPVNSNKARILCIAGGKNYDADWPDNLHMLKQLIEM